MVLAWITSAADLDGMSRMSPVMVERMRVEPAALVDDTPSLMTPLEVLLLRGSALLPGLLEAWTTLVVLLGTTRSLS